MNSYLLSTDHRSIKGVSEYTGVIIVLTDIQITGTAHFSNDLGLDSLDTVEVVMAIEEDFSIEIPDKEADAITSGMLTPGRIEGSSDTSQSNRQ